MERIKKSFIIVMVLALLAGYFPINIKAESDNSTKNYFNIREIMNKNKENINDQDALKIRLLNERIDQAKITISVSNLTEIEKYFSIKDNQIFISEAFVNDNDLTSVDKSLVLNAILDSNNELQNNNMKVRADYQIINDKDGTPDTFGGNINKTLKYWWGNRIYRDKKKTAAAISKYQTMLSKVGFVQALLQTFSVIGSIPAQITVGVINALGQYFANDFVNNYKINNKGNYGTKLDMPTWFAGYGIYKQTSKTK